ncbi:hypothetical protein [uncultured Tateyamaria sp.]|uniref:hypothetical protein n=1 Tax=uncultured Tateyamaria sp. TaxID=455651 RepID=UPI00261597BD|nr:hypothetical protein [uncultured Tateyamaria sp.]
MPRLILHIGSQKTGSTSIQTFLTQHPDKMAEAGLSYVKAGRGPAAHNKLAFKRDTEQFPVLMKRLVAEVENDPDKTHVISAEMLFTTRMARSMAEYLPDDLRAETQVIAYIRRQDKFLEAMYKQVVKTGRFKGTAQQYAQKRETALMYSKILGTYADGFGADNVKVLPYERPQFLEGDVILDMCGHLGMSNVTRDDLPEKFSNITLSREVSEMLGLISNTTDINIAELIRVIIRNEAEGAFYSGDSYSPMERREIADKYVEDNELVRATYRPDLDSLFDLSDLAGDLDNAGIPPEEQVKRLRQAQIAVFEAIGQSHTSVCEPG